ncbi:MAG: Lrp/AsnC ligand binding domain-containing protein [Dehalococcoidia bacterium]
MDLKHVLQKAPGVNRRFVYYLESQGHIRPTRLQKERIARRDYSEDDLWVIQETWRYYSQGFSLQAAYDLGVKKERKVSYVTFQVSPRLYRDVLERLKELPDVVEASVVYSDTMDFIVKLSTPREADIYHSLFPLFAQTGVVGVPGMWHTVGHFERKPGGPGEEAKPRMMAYVLMKVPGKNVDEVMNTLKELTGVVEASTVYGESDIIARVVVASQDDLDSLVMDRIHNIPAVESTRTYIAVSGMHWARP